MGMWRLCEDGTQPLKALREPPDNFRLARDSDRKRKDYSFGKTTGVECLLSQNLKWISGLFGGASVTELA